MICDCRHTKNCNNLTVEKVLEQVPSPACPYDRDDSESFNGAVVQESMVNHELLKAARDGRTADVAVHLWNGAFLETRRPFAITFEADLGADHEAMGLTPLMYAALGGYTSTCELLLSARADVDAEDEDGMRPLHFAATSGNMEACRVLLRYGADPGCLDAEGRTALEHVPPIDACTRAEKQGWEALLGKDAPRPDKARQAAEERQAICDSQKFLLERVRQASVPEAGTASTPLMGTPPALGSLPEPAHGEHGELMVEGHGL